MPGWNFCTYFILKVHCINDRIHLIFLINLCLQESLASSFEGMNLHDEALVTYDELEALFFQVLREKNLSWFGVLANPSRQDDSAPLLSVTKKPYRDLILANSISVFDFRVYLLARQCALLSSMGRVVDVGRKVVSFLNAFGRRLREIQVSIIGPHLDASVSSLPQEQLPPHFLESWIYSSALSVVDQCNAWAKSMELAKPTLAAFNAVRGELLELARHQVNLASLHVELGLMRLSSTFSALTSVSYLFNRRSRTSCPKTDRRRTPTLPSRAWTRSQRPTSVRL